MDSFEYWLIQGNAGKQVPGAGFPRLIILKPYGRELRAGIAATGNYHQPVCTPIMQWPYRPAGAGRYKQIKRLMDVPIARESEQRDAEPMRKTRRGSGARIIPSKPEGVTEGAQTEISHFLVRRGSKRGICDCISAIHAKALPPTLPTTLPVLDRAPTMRHNGE